MLAGVLVGATLLSAACVPDPDPIGSTTWTRQDFAPDAFVRVVASRGADVVVRDTAFHVLAEDGTERWSIAAEGPVAVDDAGNLRVLSGTTPAATSVTIYAAADGTPISRHDLPPVRWSSIAVDTAGSTWVSGMADGIIDLGGGPLGTNTPHLVLLRLSADGTYEASASFGSPFGISTLMPLRSGGIALLMGAEGVFAFDATATPRWEIRTSLRTAVSHESGELSLIGDNAVIRYDGAQHERWRTSFNAPFAMAAVGEELIVSSRTAFGDIDADQTTLRRLDAAGTVVAREALPSLVSLPETTSASTYWLQIGGGTTVDLHDLEVSAPPHQTIVAARAL